MTAATIPTSVALPSHYIGITREHARAFAAALINGMRLNAAEKAALIHAPTFFATKRDVHGVILSRRGEVYPTSGWTGPVAVTYDPEMCVNTMERAACWISALRGSVAKRGSRVMTEYNGRAVFGTVKRVNDDGTVRIALDDDQVGFAKFTTGVYLGRTLTSVDVSMCAVLAA
jgi:hypothetical protein